VTTPEHALDDELGTDLRVAEELQDRLLREQQTAAALRAYLLGKGDEL
jgi:hypothetical protein